MTLTVYHLPGRRVVVELPEPREHPFLALELHLWLSRGRTRGVWRWSQSGAVLAVLRAGAA